MNERAAMFGEKLRDLRKSAKKSQTEMADEIAAQFPGLRISQTTLSALEQRTEPPRRNVVEVLADYFGISADYFAARDPETLALARAHVDRLRDDDESARGYAVASRRQHVMLGHYSDDDYWDT